MPTVRIIFEMVADGQTLYGISNTLNTEGVPTMGGGKRWYPVSMKRLIDDTVGLMRYAFGPSSYFWAAGIILLVDAFIFRIT